jgi:predicted GIY-YIG superfamily endonuclease
MKWHWFVYIIECEDGLYYTGMTYDLEKRLEQHKTGQGSKFTAKHKFKCLRYKEEYFDITEARNREHQLKDFSRQKKEMLWQNVNK